MRHGNTFLAEEPARRIGAHTDLALTDEGRAQARRVGEWFARERLNPGPILCGPLARATDTAVMVGAAWGSGDAPVVADWLDEIDHGPDEGKSEAQAVSRLGRDALDRWDRFAEVPAGWRVDPAAQIATWRKRVDGLASGTSVLITSNGVARFAILALVGDAQPRILKLRTGAVGVIIVGEEHTSLTAWDVRPDEATADLLRDDTQDRS